MCVLLRAFVVGSGVVRAHSPGSSAPASALETAVVAVGGGASYRGVIGTILPSSLSHQTLRSRRVTIDSSLVNFVGLDFAITSAVAAHNHIGGSELRSDAGRLLLYPAQVLRALRFAIADCDLPAFAAALEAARASGRPLADVAAEELSA